MKVHVKKIYLLLLVFAAIVFSTAIKWIWNELSAPPVGVPSCKTASEAMRRGTWVCNVVVEPEVIQINNHTIIIKESWIEEAALIKYWLVWFPYYEKQGWQYLCFTLDQGHEVFLQTRAPFFVLENKGSGFSMTLAPTRTGVFCEELEGNDSTQIQTGSLTMHFISSWKDPSVSVHLSLRRR